MTIEERALDYAVCKSCPTISANGYMHGAEEQRQIDIDKVCDLMVTLLNDGTIETRDIGKVNTIIRETLKQ